MNLFDQLKHQGIMHQGPSNDENIIRRESMQEYTQPFGLSKSSNNSTSPPLGANNTPLQKPIFTRRRFFSTIHDQI